MDTAILRAATIVGGQSELARRLGIKRQAVHKWVRTGVTPAKRCMEISQLTGGQVTLHELRPDVYPAAGLEANA